MLQIADREGDFLARVSRRYRLTFVITGESVREVDEYGTVTVRPASSAEMQMWERLISPPILAKINLASMGEPQTLKATPEELQRAIQSAPVVYLNAVDFSVLREGQATNHPPLPSWQIQETAWALRGGQRAWAGNTTIYVSREIPQGYYLALQKPDDRLNPPPPEPGEEQIRAPLESWDFALQSL